MHDSVRQALSKELFAFVRSLKLDDIYINVDSPQQIIMTAEKVASHFTNFFSLPCPMVTCHASSLIQQVQINEVYLQPGLEKFLHIRGQWITERDIEHDKLIVIILIEEARPDPSKIKTLLHELIEQVLYIYYDGPPPFADNLREKWADQFAAFVKMPREKFSRSVLRLGLDHVAIADEFQETFSGVSRHIRNLIMKDRPYYFSRVRVEGKPQIRCPHQGIEAKILETGGICVKVEDAVRTGPVKGRLKNGSLPLYNVALTDQYRVMNPELIPYLESKQPIYIPCMFGASGYGGPSIDLFEDQQLSVLLYPYPNGNQKARGFYMVAVHPQDGCLLEAQRQNILAACRPDIDWIFDWIVAYFKQAPDPEIEAEYEEQKSMEIWGDVGPRNLPDDRTSWPRVAAYSAQQTMPFNDGIDFNVDDKSE